MKKKFLVVSNIERKNSKKNIYPFFSAVESRDQLKNYCYNFEYLNNYSSNSKLIIKDSKYLLKFYEKLLNILSKLLNKKHNLHYDSLFWRILIGPWLGMFIYSYYLKWKTINKIKNKNDKFKIKIYSLNNDELVPKNMEHFSSLINSELWHQKIGQKICQNFFIKKNQFFVNKLKINNNGLKSDGLNFKKIVILVLNTLFKKKDQKYLIINSYLGFFREIFLNLKLKQYPTFDIFGKKLKSRKVNFNERKKLYTQINSLKFKKKFERNFIKDFVNEIPTSFLEGFEDLELLSKELNLPEKPKIIFSSNFHRNTLLSYYIAKKKLEGSKLYIGQHGGLYGATLFSWFEKHEIKISDNFFSWGWKTNEKKIKNLGILIKLKNIKWNIKNKKILFLLRSRNKYPASFLSGTNTENYLNYCNNLNKIFLKLNKDIKKKIVLRYPPNFFSKQNKNSFINTKDLIIDNNDNFYKKLKNSALAINTTHSTPFLQVMAINFPNILILNGKDNPIKDTKSFNLLKKANIFHDNYKSASKFINNLDSSEKIFNWWYSNNTQKAVNVFCNKHAKFKSNITNNIKKIMTK